MDISVTDAKAQLTDLVRRVEAGDDVVLTRHGHAVVRLVPVRPAINARSRKAVIDLVRASAAARFKAKHATPADRSQDFLYGEDGLPK